MGEYFGGGEFRFGQWCEVDFLAYCHVHFAIMMTWGAVIFQNLLNLRTIHCDGKNIAA